MPSMVAIVDSGFTFSIASLATLAAVLDSDALAVSFSPQSRNWEEAWQRCGNPFALGSFPSPVKPTVALWASVLAASPPASMSQIEPEQIRAVLALALQGGGMAASTAVDTADRLHRNQNGRHFDFLAAQIVNAVVAAGV
jgi:hypothetical protein